MKTLLLFLVLFNLSATISFGQDSLSRHNKVSAVRFISHDYDNDVFTNTDYYYTQGVRYELVFPYLQNSSVHFVLPGFRHLSVNYYGVTWEQKCYTPTSLKSDTVLRGDRPYASVLYSGRFRVSNDELHHQRMKTEIDLGLTGHCALCDDEQKAIHRALVDQQPLGWGTQIRQDLILNYSIAYDKGVVNTKYVQCVLQGKVDVGSLYDRAIAGGMIRAGKMCSYFSLYGPGENEASKKVLCYGFIKGWVQGVGYDATLQGGLFDRNNVYVISDKNVERLVYGYQYGIVFSYRKLSLQYALVHITPEFSSGRVHAWGHINISVAF